MNGELAQRIALVAHGNVALRGLVDDRIDENTTLQFVRTITFAFMPRRRFARSTAPVHRVSDWFEELKSRSVRRLELDCIGRRPIDAGPLPDHVAVASAGAERSPIVVQREGTSELWRAAWEVATVDRPADNRIWQVRYQGEDLRAGVALQHPSVSDASRQLSAALAEVEDFARSNDAGHWSDWFAEARELLLAESPEIPYHPDLLPAGVDRSRQRLLAGATKAYVFGGMGSWNDMGFRDSAVQERYEALSRLLYESMMLAFDAATNAADT